MAAWIAGTGGGHELCSGDGREGECRRIARPAAAIGGQIVIETGTLSIRIPCDVSADHIERVLLAVQVSA